MADYTGVMLWDPADTTEEYLAWIPPVEILIDAEDADDWSPSYEPTEGCTP